MIVEYSLGGIITIWKISVCIGWHCISFSDEDEDGNPKLDEDGNRIKKKKKKKGKDKDEDKTAFGTLTDEDMKQLLLKTSYNTEEIMQWHFDFLDECPTGKLSKAHLQRLFKKVFPNGDTENFVAFIFRLFDIDHSNILEFNEFLQVSTSIFWKVMSLEWMFILVSLIW